VAAGVAEDVLVDGAVGADSVESVLVLVLAVPSPGSVNTFPTVMLSEVKWFAALIAATVVPFLCAIFESESPDFTV
jgi:hypothetical protein